MNEPVIEPATIEDLPQLVELLIDLFSHESDFRLDPEKHSRGLQLILEQPNRGRIFVLKNHDRIVGMLNLLFTISTAEGAQALVCAAHCSSCWRLGKDKVTAKGLW